MRFTFFVEPEYYHNKPKIWWLYQIWFNLVGFLIGWVIFYVLLRKFFPFFDDTQCLVLFSIWDAVGAFVAFIGVTGNLPFAGMKLVEASRQIAGNVPNPKP